jgi:cellulose synthase/poly-beta-1,6-N-acetylglucosamine synthase-like glycosyltransferase
MVLVALGTALMVIMGSYLVLVVILSRRSPHLPTSGGEDLRFVFLVPALNEERVIANTVDSLLAIPGDRHRVLVIDDHSDDRTAEIVRRYPSDRVWLLQRRLPDARLGKGEALNDAYSMVCRRVMEAELDPELVVLSIVDGDGRLRPDVIDVVGPLFARPTLGAAQIQVRIYNRATGWLARFQDYEFLTFSTLTQRARQHLGSVGLGGNGQFTRLAALQSLGEAPWSDCLTEDLDLGLRLAMAGWENGFTDATAVEQQGLTRLRPIVRQRTRWMQGHFQCWRHVPDLVRSPLATTTVLDLLWYLAAPGVTLVVSIIFGLPAIVLALTLVPAIVGHLVVADWLRWVVPVYLLSFGPSLIFSLAYWRRAGDISLLRAFVMAHLLSVYNYVWYLATWKAVGRAALGRRGWAKTSRVVDDVEVVDAARADVA